MRACFSLSLALIHGAACVSPRVAAADGRALAPSLEPSPGPSPAPSSKPDGPMLYDDGIKAEGQCSQTVAYLFLVDAFPLADVWSEYFSNCEPGAAVAHIHSQAALSAPVPWSQSLPTHIVADPVQGSMRFNYTFVEAMLKLWDSGLQHLAPNGCQPRWLQLVSDSCAPVQSCQKVHASLATRPGKSVLEASRCTAGDAECYSRWPASGWPVGNNHPSVWTTPALTLTCGLTLTYLTLALALTPTPTPTPTPTLTLTPILTLTLTRWITPAPRC